MITWGETLNVLSDGPYPIEDVVYDLGFEPRDRPAVEGALRAFEEQGRVAHHEGVWMLARDSAAKDTRNE